MSSNFAPAEEAVRGDAVIRRAAGQSEIVITTTSRLAGAIHSLTWGGKEFIDSADHGRQLQSAANFDAGGPFIPEVFNPTEAGSMRDGDGKASSSKLLFLQAADSQLRTKSQMAFWLAPGEKSAGQLARNEAVLSDHGLAKRVKIGHGPLDQVLEYDVTFTMPAAERHTYAQFEAVTGYMPAEFERFWRFDSASGQMQPLDDGPGEQSQPVVLATNDSLFAMGVYSPDQPSAGYEQAGYGRFRFAEAKVVKWNCVFRFHEAAGIPPGDHSFRCYVCVGTLAEVREALIALAAENWSSE
ncbi:MAG: hypothetical protein AB7O62_26195 [Pirellulales bacterium]